MVLRSLLIAILIVAGSTVSAQASVSTGAISYAGSNFLDEWYFDVNFGATPQNAALSTSLVMTGDSGVQVDLWVVNMAAASTTAAEVANFQFGFSLPGQVGGGSATAPIWGTGALAGFPQGPFNLSGLHRFIFTVRPSNASGTYPANITVGFNTNSGTLVAPVATGSGNTGIVPGSTGVVYRAWPPQFFGPIGSSTAFHRQHMNTVLGEVLFGSATDELAFFIDVTMNGVPIDISLRALAFTSAGSGQVDFEVYDMQAGWDEPVLTASANTANPGNAGASLDSGYTTGPYTGLARFRVVAVGQNMTVTGATTADFRFDLFLSTPSEVLAIVRNPELAPPRMEMVPSGMVISQTTGLAVTGGSTPVSYDWTLQGTVPTGVSLSATTGANVDLVVTGTPPPNSSVFVRCTNGFTNEFTEQEFIVDVPAGPQLQITGPANLPAGTEGVAYSEPVTASGGTMPYTWSITAGALPPGLSIDPGTGVISGVPMAAGSYPGIEVTVADSASATDAVIFNLDIQPAVSVQIDTASLANGTEGVLYSANIVAIGGNAPYDWSIVGGALPAGVTLGTSTTDTVSLDGTPTVNGTFNFTVRVEEVGGADDTRLLTLIIDPPPVVITITTAGLTAGVEGTVYTADVTVSGGSAPYTWSIVNGTLHAGLALGASTTDTVTISGTPTEAGSRQITIRVEEASGAFDERQFLLVISPPPAPPPPVGSSSSGGSGSCSSGARGGLAWCLLGIVAAAMLVRRRRSTVG